MNDPGPSAVKVAVRVAREPDGLGEWLADATSFDAAGADALWVDAGPEPRFDVLALTAALAVSTFRTLLVVTPPRTSASPAELARTLETIRVLSHGRLAFLAGPEDRIPALRVPVLRPVPDGPGDFEAPGEERWSTVPAPRGRAAWRGTCADAAGRGAHGVVVPADPVLLDILRNPDEPEGRRDLLLAQG
ncbi:hypothetical protein SRB5_02630 [Streptomyces sp. RB5]|uniref:Luciferase-like monooxygenase n=1 Tax=Streptomyces smaragdinus TaxID=2585196 RepID=A0A7K0C9T6_9ACTN|nr:LLM class flavin-dependent oxidoreductase [Streptomyces smaragdinus]MQY10156.1 hypothetical protein [Streptomyces smaragdinus]